MAALRFPGQQKQIPGEAGGGDIRALLAPANDLPMVIVVAGVGGVDRVQWSFAGDSPGPGAF